MVAGLILAGGKSKRFGSDKRFYKLKGKTLFEIACEKISEVCDKNYVISDKDFTVNTINLDGFVILRDLEEGKGPIMGIYSALLRIHEEGCLAIPVDMPNLTVSFLKYIKELSNSFDLVVPYSYEPLPLPGFYSKKHLPFLKSALNNEDLSLKSLIIHTEHNRKLKIIKLYFDDIKRFGDPERILININKKDDVESME